MITLQLDFLDGLLANFIGRILYDVVVKGAPLLKKKLVDQHYRSRWSNPWYKWFVIDNTFLATFTLLYGWCIVSWVGGLQPFDTTSIVISILAAPLFFWIIRSRVIDKENYEVSSLMDALRGDSLTINIKPKA